MKRWRIDDCSGSTRVSRVYFGVPPKCARAHIFALARVHLSQRHVPPVLGGTPKTTRETRVLPIAIGDFLQA
jgi:hypothetical protein